MLSFPVVTVVRTILNQPNAQEKQGSSILPQVHAGPGVLWHLGFGLAVLYAEIWITLCVCSCRGGAAVWVPP